MADFSAQIQTTAPSEKVWAQLIDLGSWDRWNTTHTGFPQGTPGPLEAGTSFQEGLLLMGFPAEITWKVTELEPNRLLSLSGKGPAGVKLRQVFRLAPTAEGGTDLAIENAVTGAAVTLMAGKVREAGTDALNESLPKLTSLVE